jgi:hypothetical protein
LRDRRISRKLAGSDAALEVGERDHRHFSPGETEPLLRSAPGSGKRVKNPSRRHSGARDGANPE